MAKKSRVWDGTAWQELASAQTDLTAYSTTAQMNTAITAGVGLVPILTQTIGTAVSSVVVSNAFSATYDNYRIILAGGSHSTGGVIIGLQMGATATGYYWGTSGSFYSSATGAFSNGSNTSSWGRAGIGQTTGMAVDVNIYNPFNTVVTTMSQAYISAETAGAGGAGGGYLTGTTSYTGFTLTPSSGTMTGGTIRVYGYKN